MCSEAGSLKRSRVAEESSNTPIDNVRIEHISALAYPNLILEHMLASPRITQTVAQSRAAITDIIQGKDLRLLVIIGPCSIHDTKAAVEYAERLAVQAQKYEEELHIIMRVYFEKPRTTIGWKGLINDPMLDNSFQVNKGLEMARQLLLDINSLGLSVGCEFLDATIPQYIADLVSWGAIGARTTESQLHRELASGLSMPVGFKNGTGGDVQVAVDACRSAVAAHSFLGITKAGMAAIVHSKGNEDVHIILRGGAAGPNYEAEDIKNACKLLSAGGVNENVIIDFSHGNSRKDHKRQIIVTDDVSRQIRGGQHHIVGCMIESHLFEGAQILPSHGGSNRTGSFGEQSVISPMTERRSSPRALQTLKYGVSITDKCIGWEDTLAVLETLAKASRERRSKLIEK